MLRKKYFFYRGGSLLFQQTLKEPSQCREAEALAWGRKTLNSFEFMPPRP